jgi:hypothetical protein
MPKYVKLLNSDEDQVPMHAVVHKNLVNGGGYKVRKSHQAGTGRMPRPPNAQRRQVRIKIKTHDKARGAYRSSVQATLNYVAKEGRIFDRDRELDGRDLDRLADEWTDDRSIHHWIISPQDGERMNRDQVMEMTRATMAHVQSHLPEDVREDFRWTAGAEEKDGRWHAHVAVRGVVNDKDLTFHPVFERHWIRAYAEEAVTDQIGWRGARALEDERTHRDRTNGRDMTEERERDRERSRTRDMTDDRGRDNDKRRRHREMEMEREL